MNHSFAKIASAGALGLAFAYVVIAVGWAAVARTRSPTAALALAPWDARAEARLADTMISPKESLRTVKTAATLARDALGRDATIPSAWRTLGLFAGARGDEAGASRMMHVAQRMSRRDLPTQMWLIEERVGADDIGGALQHYDIALSSSAAGANVLMPILVNASSDPAIAQSLTPLMKRRSPWRAQFLQRLAYAPSPDSATVLVEAAASNEDRPLPDIYEALANHYIARRSFNAGLRILHAAAGDANPIPALRNGRFDTENHFPPYDWRFTNAANPNVLLASMPGRSGYRLEMNATSGNGGMAAEQLLSLAPGAYRVAAQKGTQDGVAPAQIELKMECAKSGAPLLRLPLASGTSAMTFEVPAKECSAQWIRVMLVPDFSTSQIGGWVDNIALTRLR